MGLIIPASHVIHDEAPKFLCVLCDAMFTADERHQFERHVLAHPMEDVLAHSPKHNAPGLYDPYWEGGDVEWQEWIDRNKAAGNDPARYMRTDDGKHSSGMGDG